MNTLTSARNAIIRFFYVNIAKKIFFMQDPEDVHDRMTFVGKFLGKYTITRAFTSMLFSYSNIMLEQTVAGIHFKNPIGLSAGFDKNAELTDILPSVGFGFEEIGSITGEYCAGNPRPRLWRLPKSQGLAVWYGLKNDGAELVHQRLVGKKFSFPIGVSIAKTNNAETVNDEAGVKDYIKGFTIMKDIGGYMTINISCPNTCGGEPFTEPNKLDSLLSKIDGIQIQKPIFLKISCDISKENIDEIITVVEKHNVQGFVCTNLTKKRNNPKIIDDVIPEKGSLSGKIVEDLSNNIIEYIYKKTGGKYIIIGTGGVFTGKDAYKKIRLGATLIQLITGMIFEGPQAISQINLELTELLKKDGFTNISQAIGVDSK